MSYSLRFNLKNLAYPIVIPNNEVRYVNMFPSEGSNTQDCIIKSSSRINLKLFNTGEGYVYVLSTNADKEGKYPLIKDLFIAIPSNSQFFAKVVDGEVNIENTEADIQLNLVISKLTAKDLGGNIAINAICSDIKLLNTRLKSAQMRFEACSLLQSGSIKDLEASLYRCNISVDGLIDYACVEAQDSLGLIRQVDKADFVGESAGLRLLTYDNNDGTDYLDKPFLGGLP